MCVPGLKHSLSGLQGTLLAKLAAHRCPGRWWLLEVFKEGWMWPTGAMVVLNHRTDSAISEVFPTLIVSVIVFSGKCCLLFIQTALHFS